VTIEARPRDASTVDLFIRPRNCSLPDLLLKHRRPAFCFPLRRGARAALALAAAVSCGRLGAADGQPEPPELPRLATGAQELQWIDANLPETADASRRRRALEEVIATFPDERETVFRSQTRIAIADWDLGAAADAHARLEGILGDTHGIDRDIVAWAQVIDARILAGLRRQPEAEEELRTVYSDHRLSPARRALAVAAAADLDLPDSPDAALALLRGVGRGDKVQPAVEAAIVHALLVAGNGDEAAAEVSALAEGKDGERALTDLLEAAGSWGLRGDAARVEHLADLVLAARPEPGADLAAAVSRVRAAASLQVIHARLSQLRREAPLSAWTAVGPADARLGRGALDQAISEASAQRNPRRCLQLELRAAVLEGSGAQLPRRLWQAAGYADWVERAAAKPAGAGVCDLLLDLCDQLPSASDYWMEGKLLRAARRVRAEDRPGEQALLGQVLAAGPRPAYLAVTCQMMGRSLEATGDNQKALAVYGTNESAIAAYPAGVDALLHAVLIHLDDGDDDQAIRLLGLLQSSPAHAVQASGSAAEIRELAAVVASGRALECWKAGRAWWTEWKQTEATLPDNARSVREAVPDVPNPAELAAEARRAADGGDTGLYFRRFGLLLSAARWLPSAAPEAAGVAAPALRFAPARRTQLRGMLIRMLESPHPETIPGIRKRQMFLAANYLNARQPDEALRVAALFLAAAAADEPLAPAVHQIRGLAALDAGRDYAAALADLESDLIRRPDLQRAMTVGVVADLYHRLGRDDDARRLLGRELGNPTLAHDPGRGDLARRLARLTPGTAAPANPGSPADPTDAWITAVGLDWLGYTAPASLAEAGLPSLDRALKDAGSYFPPAGQIKFLLLASREPSLTAAQRQGALGEACVRIVLSARTLGRLDQVARPVVDSPAFADEVRLRVLWTVLAELAENGHPGAYNSWRKDPLCAGFSADFQHQLAVLDQQAALDRGASDKILDWAEHLGAHDLDFAGLQTMGDLFGLLLQDGDLGRAGELATEAQGWRVEAGLADALASLQLDFRRRLRQAQALEPIHMAMKGVLGASYRAPAALPPEFRDQLAPGTLAPHAPGPTFQAALYLAATNQFDRRDLGFWQTVLGSLPLDPRGSEAAAALLGAGLAATADDALRAELIIRFISSADIDNPEVRAGLERVCAPFRRPAEGPQCYLAIRLYEIQRDLRLGKPYVPEVAFQDLSDPRVPIVRARDSLHYYLRVGDLAALRRVVSSIDSSALIGPGLVADAIPALAALGETDELAAARDAARRLLRRDIAESWSSGDAGAAASALDLALALHEPGTLPAGWVRDLGSDLPGGLVAGRVRLVAAFLRADWSGVLAAAVALNRDFPNRYSFYWYRGLALHRLGRDGEAAAPLAIFLAHAKDDSDYPEAAELLGKLGAPAANPEPARPESPAASVGH
jgi:hypothetical protein